jgi:hypothetical protein
VIVPGGDLCNEPVDPRQHRHHQLGASTARARCPRSTSRASPVVKGPSGVAGFYSRHLTPAQTSIWGIPSA